MPSTVEELVAQAKAAITEISVSDAQQLNSEKTVFVDVREPPEWQAGTITSALCIPRGVLEWKCSDEDKLADKSAPIVVYCKSGGRSALAAQTLQQLGFSNVQSLAGGYQAWSEAQ